MRAPKPDMIRSFRVFDPTPCHFPAPSVPLLPTPGIASFTGPRADRYRFLGEGHAGIFFSRGRYALRTAFQQAGIGPGKVLLAPAYHCRTMIDPAVRVGGEVMLYPLTAALEPDWEGIKALIANASSPPSALLLTHYFGIRQNLERAAAMCRQLGLTLIEDCSHAFIWSRHGTPPGTFSDHVVASPYKFVPCDDGGLLISRHPLADRDQSLQPRGLIAEMKALWRMLERFRRAAGGFNPSLTSSPLASEAPTLGREYRQPGDSISGMYDTAIENHAGYRLSRLAIALSSPDRIADARRENYAFWANALSGVEHCRPLFPALPDDCVPYMFPLYLDSPEPHFYRLKQLGIPIWRWDEMADSDCPIAMDYRDHLLHLPCHQSLDRAALEWMTGTVIQVLTEKPRSGA